MCIRETVAVLLLALPDVVTRIVERSPTAYKRDHAAESSCFEPKGLLVSCIHDGEERREDAKDGKDVPDVKVKTESKTNRASQKHTTECVP